jgi:hypothetical protein
MVRHPVPGPRSDQPRRHPCQRRPARGLPAVRGETVEGDVAGYHNYPGREQVVHWFGGEGLTIIDEGFKWEDGWGYRHFLLR